MVIQKSALQTTNIGEFMTLQAQIDDFKIAFKKNVPEDIQALMKAATDDLANTGIVQKATSTGDKLVPFALPNHLGDITTLEALLAKGPIVLTFYRGGWCPYCNLELKAYQDILKDIHAKGASLVAITPETPDNTLTTIEKNGLNFEVLTDKGANYAKELGLVFSLPNSLRPIYEQFGIDVQKHNGQGHFELPLAATYIVKSDGIICYSFVDADYTKRAEPADILDALKNI